VLEPTKCRSRQASVARTCLAGPRPFVPFAILRCRASPGNGPKIVAQGARRCENIPWKSKSISRRDAKPQRHKANNAVDLSESLRLGVSARDGLFFHSFASRGGIGPPLRPSPLRGERNHLDPDIRRAFRRTGTACRPLRVHCRRTKKGRASPTAVQISGGPVVAMLQRMGLGGPESRFREQVGGWGGTVLSKFTPRLPPAAKAERGGPVLRPEGVGKADRAKRTDRDRRRVAVATKPPNWIRTSHRKLATAST